MWTYCSIITYDLITWSNNCNTVSLRTYNSIRLFSNTVSNTWFIHTYKKSAFFFSYIYTAQLILNGAVQLFVHTASKYDSCQILNFPRAKATLNLNWFCGGKSPNRHHYVVRCAPDKIPVQPDKQVLLAGYNYYRVQLSRMNLWCQLRMWLIMNALFLSTGTRLIQWIQISELGSGIETGCSPFYGRG